MKQGNDNLALWIKRTNVIIQKTNEIVAITGVDQKAITSFIPKWTEDIKNCEENQGLETVKTNEYTKLRKTKYYNECIRMDKFVERNTKEAES